MLGAFKSKYLGFCPSCRSCVLRGISGFAMGHLLNQNLCPKSTSGGLKTASSVFFLLGSHLQIYNRHLSKIPIFCRIHCLNLNFLFMTISCV